MPDKTDTHANGHAAEPTDGARLLSVDRLAERLDISVRSVWRLRAAGKLPAPVHLGGSVRWRWEEIEDWIAAGCPASE